MSTQPVTFGNTRQLEREIVNKDAFKATLDNQRSASTELTASSGRKTALDDRSGTSNPAPVRLASTGFRPTERYDAMDGFATSSRFDSGRRREENAPAALIFSSRTDDTRNDAADDVSPVTMRSTSNGPTAILRNVGQSTNGEGGLFVNPGEEASVEEIRETLNNRFPDGEISLEQLIEKFNIEEHDARNFMRHHGVANTLSVDALMRHVSRWKDEDGNLTQARFEAAIENGASHLNVNRFEHEEGQGYEFGGFTEMYRRAGGYLSDDIIGKIYNQVTGLDWKGEDHILERSELVSLGIAPDEAGDVRASDIVKAMNIRAFGEPPATPPVYTPPAEPELPAPIFQPREEPRREYDVYHRHDHYFPESWNTANTSGNNNLWRSTWP